VLYSCSNHQHTSTERSPPSRAQHEAIRTCDQHTPPQVLVIRWGERKRISLTGHLVAVAVAVAAVGFYLYVSTLGSQHLRGLTQSC
jgi:hypothetical protein